MNNKSTASATSYGIGFPGLLTIVLLILKLTGYIDWSWWWVFAPVLIGFAIGMVLLVFFLVLAALAVWAKS